MTDNKYTETEIKLYVPVLENVVAKLTEIGATLTAPRVFERNVRYDTPDEALRANHAVLRLRSDTRARLTYKDGERQTGQFGTTRFEAEVEVSDFEAMETILLRLGYASQMVYEKYRTTYEFDDVEITLDEMPYGNFVEIEGTDERIGRMLERLDLLDAPRLSNSYVVLFEWVRQNLGLTFTDLSFANFKDIDVPFAAFTPKNG